MTKNQEQTKTAASSTVSAASKRQHDQPEDFQALTENVCNAVENYSRKHPATVATAIFFLGFYVGWKVKPW